jgi:hypothetical protein
MREAARTRPARHDPPCSDNDKTDPKGQRIEIAALSVGCQPEDETMNQDISRRVAALQGLAFHSISMRPAANQQGWGLLVLVIADPGT